MLCLTAHTWQQIPKKCQKIESNLKLPKSPLEVKIMTTTKNRLWTVEEYHRMIDAGILTTADKVELLDGNIMQMSPQSPLHAGTTQCITYYLQNLLQGKAYIRVQLPITLSTSEPEPDIAVVRIDPKFYIDHHPNASEILLLIEVSYGSLEVDKQIKIPIYARANIAEYWIVDTITRQVYIYRQPQGGDYQQKITLPANASIAPLTFPEITVNFAEAFFPG
jgi:Uma2 family endonuclease